MTDRYTPNPTVVLRTAARQAGWDLAEFDRVLNQVKAEAWDEGIGDAWQQPRATNPYKEE